MKKKERINMSAHQQDAHSKLAWWFFAIVGVGIFGIVAFIIMMRINYKVHSARSGFWSVIGWVVLMLLIIAVLIMGIFWMMNLYAKHEEDKKIKKRSK